MTLKFYNGKAGEMHNVFYCSILAHFPQNGKFNLSGIQFAVFTYHNLKHLFIYLFFAKVTFSVLCLLAE